MQVAERAGAVHKLSPDPIVSGSRILTPAEIRFEAWRRSVGLLAGPLVLAVIWLAPLPLPRDAHLLAGIMCLVVVWWVSEAVPLPVTSLVGTALTVVMGIATAQVAFAPFATPVIFLFIGSFIMGRAISVHGLDARIAHALLSSRFVGGRVSRVPLALGLLTVSVSGWISGTATTAMMAPLAVGIMTAIRTHQQDSGRTYGSRLMLTIAFAASVGSKVTPIGAPTNLVALGFLMSMAGVRIDFFTWMMIGVPMTIVMATALIATMHWLLKDGPLEGATIPAEKWRTLSEGPLTPGQRNCLIVFCLAAVLWITPGVVVLFTSGEGQLARLLTDRLDLGTVAILAASLLFLMPARSSGRQWTLEWKEATQIDWGTILLFGGGLSLGQLMFSTGLSEALGRGLIALSGADTLWSITAMSVAATILLTQFTSNTATATMLTPVVLSISFAAGVHPVPPALGVAFAAGVPFLLPISSPPNAIAYGTGLIRIGDMIKVGAVLNLVGFFAIFLALRLICPWLGFS
jgi:solute carrier family 13 (sodium-dependent dicarboxylate transporter), member 2/3/5